MDTVWANWNHRCRNWGNHSGVVLPKYFLCSEFPLFYCKVWQCDQTMIN